VPTLFQSLLESIRKGGPGSGNWGHKGVPGQRGGSAPGGGKGRVSPSVAYGKELSEKEIVDSSLMGRGMNDAELVVFDDGSKAVRKTVTGSADDTSLKGRDGQRRAALAEGAAYDLDQALGFGIVPRTATIMEDGEVAGSLQEFVSGAKVGFNLTGTATDEVYESLSGEQGAVLDFITAQSDRHNGNWMAKNGKFVAIDNDQAFHAAHEWPYGSIDAWHGKKISKSVQESIKGISSQDIRRITKPFGLDVQKACVNRWQYLVDNGALPSRMEMLETDWVNS
jgi:hypothetical protein